MNLSHRFEQALSATLKEMGFSLEEPMLLAEKIRQLSDFYISHPGEPTPWKENFTAPATLAYFLPLNVVRLQIALLETQRLLPESSIHEIHDFGSGLGSTQWALQSIEFPFKGPFYCFETEAEAVRWHRKLHSRFPGALPVQWNAPREPARGAMAVFSYSFLEMEKVLPDLSRFTHLLIVEPSTRDRARRLMAFREEWLQRGYRAVAPCTHGLSCPLLIHSSRDWCHFRIPFHPPTWWTDIEEHLPMKNRTLTFSYLLLSREELSFQESPPCRVIGDTLKEKGKTRQLVCRGDKKEFLAWLHRHGPAQHIPSHALIQDLGEHELKGNEIRPAHNLNYSFANEIVDSQFEKRK